MAHYNTLSCHRTSHNEVQGGDKVVVLEPQGVKNIVANCKSHGNKYYLVYLDASEEILKECWEEAMRKKKFEGVEA